jgi:hypothetical protein
MSVTPRNQIVPSQSSFVSTLKMAGFTAAAFIINLVVIHHQPGRDDLGDLQRKLRHLLNRQGRSAGLFEDRHAANSLTCTDK